MTPNAFIGKKDKPTEAELIEALGKVKPVWDQLLADLAADFGVTTAEWKSYSQKAGWSLRLLRGKRTIVWIAPCAGSFRAAFVLGEKAVQAAREGGLPARVLKIIDEAPRYPEGTGVRLEIKSARDISAVKKLATIKIAN